MTKIKLCCEIEKALHIKKILLQVLLLKSAILIIQSTICCQ